jgi:hypothetical protein
MPFVTTHSEATRVFRDSGTFQTCRGKDRFGYHTMNPRLRALVGDRK